MKNFYDGYVYTRNPFTGENKLYKWVSFDEAYEKLKFDSNKTALWELNQRLLKSDLK